MWKSAAIAVYSMLIGPVLAHAGSEIAWRTDYDKAVKEAKEQNKPLFLYFSTPNCVPCQKMEREKFTDPELSRAIISDTVPVKAPAGVAEAMRVRQFPTVAVTTPARAVIYRHSGYIDADTIRSKIAEAVAKSGKPRVTQAGPCGPNCSCKECWCEHTGQSCAATGKACLPMGMDAGKLAHEETRWFGDVATKANEYFGDPLPDLSRMPFVTVFARAVSEAEAVAGAIRETAAGKQYRVTALQSDSPLAKPFKLDQDQEFQKTGIKIIAQDAPETPGGFGRETDRAYEWTTAEAFERQFGRVDPKYDPNKKPPLTPGGSSLAWVLLGAGGLAGLFVLGLGAMILPSANRQPSEETDDGLQYSA